MRDRDAYDSLRQPRRTSNRGTNGDSLLVVIRRLGYLILVVQTDQDQTSYAGRVRCRTGIALFPLKYKWLTRLHTRSGSRPNNQTHAITHAYPPERGGVKLPRGMR